MSADIPNLIPDIAVYLCPGEWKAKRKDTEGLERWTLTNGPVEIDVRVGGWNNENRLALTNPYDRRLSITVSDSRTAKAIAADIGRRLLPGLMKRYKEHAEYERESTAKKDNQAQVIVRLMTASGGSLRVGNNQQHPDEVVLYDRHGWDPEYKIPSVKASHSTYSGIKLEIDHCPLVLAEKFLTMLADAYPLTTASEDDNE